MSQTLYLLAALFLPLFPLSAVFNQVFGRLRRPELRALALLLWPQAGVLILGLTERPVPQWLGLLALLTALLYAYRAIALREVGRWIGFIATSAWALLWVAAGEPALLHLQALALSLPLVLLSLLGNALERRFGAAHGAVIAGLAASAPRFAALFVIGVLAAIATPVFPGFFALLASALGQAGTAPALALAVLLVWLLWTWSGARLLQDIVVGPPGEAAVDDMAPTFTWLYVAGFCALALAGITLGGMLL